MQLIAACKRVCVGNLAARAVQKPAQDVSQAAVGLAAFGTGFGIREPKRRIAMHQ